MRQAYINHQAIDLEAQDNLRLYFNSPLFQDIASIQSNRATTYTIPRTQRNLNSIGLAHLPQVEAQFPYQLHTFAEYRDGLPLIQAGICQLLSIGPTHIELSVTWGNKLNISLLQDQYIHQIQNDTALPWLDAIYLQAHEAQAQPYGWLLYDGGKGTHIQYLQPALAVTYLLQEIERTAGIHIRYPTGTFDRAWIPTISKKPAAANRTAYTMQGGGYNMLSYASAGNKDNSTLLHFRTSTGTDPKGIIATYRNQNMGTEVDRAAITVKRAATIHIQLAMQIHDIAPPQNSDGTIPPLSIRIGALNLDTPSDLYLHFANESTLPGTALYHVQIDKEIDTSTLGQGSDPCQLFAYCYYNHNGTPISLNRPTEVQATNTSYQVAILYHELSYTEGDVFPLFNNLPPLSFIDFIKALLHLYGLYAYYDVQQENTLLLQPIDDLYAHKAEAIDYTSRLCSIERITHRLPNWAQQNAFLYQDDPSVSTSANGEILVRHQALPAYKKLVEVPFAPSDTTTYTPLYATLYPDASSPSSFPIAYIPFYNADGQVQSLKPRIVNSYPMQLAVANTADTQTILAAVFDESLHFDQHKPQGILATKYKAYSHILAQPTVVEVQLNLSLLDVLRYSEIRPLYLAGCYYMPIQLEVDGTGTATCTLLQIPPGGNYEI